MGLLHDAGLDQLYLSDIHALNPLLDAMGQRGMPVDLAKRFQAAQELELERAEALAAVRRLIPAECCPIKRYKKPPRGTPINVTCTQIAVMRTYCAYCGARRPNKKHTCWKAKPVQTEDRPEDQPLWEIRLPFVVSPKGLLTYFKYKGYAIPTKYDRSTGQKRFTSDEGALLRIALAHEDPVCAAVLRFRDVDKQLSTYVGRPDGKGGVSGGLRVTSDGLVHTVFKHDPSTLRLSSAAPNLQNLPR